MSTVFSALSTGCLLLAQDAGAEPVLQGILPTRASLMLDVVFVAMFVVVAVLAISVWVVRKTKNYQLHRKIQIVSAVTLAVTVVAFEVDMRFFSDWREQAKFSAYYESGVVDFSLAGHLLFAIPTPFIWAFVIYRAVANFRKVEPGDHSRWHRKWGRIAALMMLGTSVTGWIFYWVAFVA